MDDLLKTIISHEGTSSFAYKDTRGYLTIGCGRCIDSRCHNGLSPDEINYLLNGDIKRCVEQLSSKPYYNIQDQIRKEVLIELVFNLGISGLEDFVNFLHKMTTKDYVEAIVELKNSLWAQQVKHTRVDNICYRLINGKYP